MFEVWLTLHSFCFSLSILRCLFRCSVKIHGGAQDSWFHLLSSSSAIFWERSPSLRYFWCLTQYSLCSCEYLQCTTSAIIQMQWLMFIPSHKTGAKLALWHRLFIITFWHFAIHHVATLTPATCSTKFDSPSSHWPTTRKRRQSSRTFCTRQLASSAEWHHQHQFNSKTKWQAGHVLAKKKFNRNENIKCKRPMKRCFPPILLFVWVNCVSTLVFFFS